MSIHQNNQDYIESLSIEKRTLIHDFLSTYKKSSYNNYLSAIIGVLDVVGDKEFNKYTPTDFDKVKSFYNTTEELTPQDMYREAFFKYLVATKTIDFNQGFQRLWLWKDLEKSLKAKNLEQVDRTPKTPALSFDETTRLITFYKNNKFEDEWYMKMAFALYMLYEAGCEVDELKNNFDCKKYFQGIFTSDFDREYIIPQRFKPLFEKKILRDKNPYSNFNPWIRQVGELLGIQDLKPMNIKKTRNDNTYNCGNCGRAFLNIGNRWKIVDNRIVCNECSNNTKNEVASVVVVEIVTEKGFDISKELKDERRRLKEEIDFLELHELQIRIGKIAELYAYEYELNRLKGTDYSRLVDSTKALDPDNGYDILSYNVDGHKRFIEVKGTSKDFDEEFYISSNEIDTLRKLSNDMDKYLIYRVANVLDKDESKITLKIIENILDNDEFELQAVSWKVKCV